MTNSPAHGARHSIATTTAAEAMPGQRPVDGDESWRQKPRQRLKTVAELLDCSVAHVYNLHHRGVLTIERVADGPPTVATQVIVRLIDNPTPWTPSNRGAAGRARRARMAAERRTQEAANAAA